MDIASWIPALSTTTIFAIVLWLGRNLIATRLNNAVKYEYDNKLERLRSELKSKHDIVLNDLKIKEELELSTLRNSALNAMASRQIEFEKRRLKAVDDLWGTVILLMPAKLASEIMVRFVFEKTAKEAAINKNVRDMFITLGKNIDIKELKSINAYPSRPYVTQMAWALFLAYSSIIVWAVIKLEIIKGGLDPKFIKKDTTVDVVKSVLPDYSSYIDKYGDDACHFLLDEIENRLLTELKNMLEGAESDKASVDKAAEIVKHSKKLLEVSEEIDV
jgi:hypothetical protein